MGYQNILEKMIQKKKTQIVKLEKELDRVDANGALEQIRLMHDIAIAVGQLNTLEELRDNLLKGGA